MQHHAAGLRKLLKDDALVDGLLKDYQTIGLDAADRAMLDYATKLTITPWEMIEADVIALRDFGWSDQAILDINQVVGYFAYVNRLANGLGVPLEAYWPSEILE